MMINNTRAAVVHPSPVNTDERQETTGYAHNTWGNMTKIFNGSSESDRSSDMQFHAGLWTGPETLKDDKWRGDGLKKEIDQVRDAIEIGKPTMSD